MKVLNSEEIFEVKFTFSRKLKDDGNHNIGVKVASRTKKDMTANERRAILELAKQSINEVLYIIDREVKQFSIFDPDQ